VFSSTRRSTSSAGSATASSTASGCSLIARPHSRRLPRARMSTRRAPTPETAPTLTVRGGEEQVGCYSSLYASPAEVRRPEAVEQVRECFTYASGVGRRVTLRGGGHCFDAQAIGDDLVISLSALDRIEVLAEQRKIRVGPGATWGAILAELQPLGLVAAVTVTTEHATA